GWTTPPCRGQHWPAPLRYLLARDRADPSAPRLWTARAKPGSEGRFIGIRQRERKCTLVARQRGANGPTPCSSWFQMMIRTVHASGLPATAVALSAMLWGLWWLPLRALAEAGLGGAALNAALYGIVSAALLPLFWRRRRRLAAGG